MRGQPTGDPPRTRSLSRFHDRSVTGGLTDVDGVVAYRIDHVEELEPFLTTVVSDTDLWMFASSTGALTAGRRDADRSLFPYVTDDRLHRAAGIAGPVTVVARSGDRDGDRDSEQRWRPFGHPRTAGCTRSITRAIVGDLLVMEEHHPRWDATVRASWAPAPSFGWVRTVELVNHGPDARFEVLDGLLDVMPAGVDATTEQLRSNLVDAYKRSETGRWGTAAVYTIESLVTDRAEPGEALAATVVWSTGFPGGAAAPILDERAVGATLDGRDLPEAESLLTGRPGAYLLAGAVDVASGGRASWTIVADTDLDRAAVEARLGDVVRGDVAERLTADVAAGRARLRSLLSGADAEQRTADPVADAHHASNVLFNSMRGGVFPHGHDVPVDDLTAFVRTRNRPCLDRHAPTIAALASDPDATLAGPGSTTLRALHAAADASGDPDLVRLALEYLPLSFSRRHGDPSRPWNSFSIEVRDAAGRDVLAFEGNWRDIFQNWEALLQSFPGFFPHVVARFVNASTADGHNAYRLDRDGIDWEVPDPSDPWSNIGYWGDHQIVYLLRLLESWERFAPDAIGAWLERPVFVYADVPYTIADHDTMVAAPHDTITFEHERADAIAAREHELGTDGRLAVTAAGEIVRAGLFEKLVVPAAAKLSAFVPGGGIWMNTQRPEWNDANNALAGTGLSVVTLAHLVRYLEHLRELAVRLEGGTATVSAFVAEWVRDLTDALDRDENEPAEDDAARRALVDQLGGIGTVARRRIADGIDGSTVDLTAAELDRWCSSALRHLRATLVRSWRDDGLVDSYNRISFPTPTTASVDGLGAMLEGQVAALSSGELDARAALDVVDALYRSDLHRPDQDSFMLYPATERPSFLDRNTLTPDQIDRAPFLTLPLADPWAHVFATGQAGSLHFRPVVTNAATLGELLDRIGAPPAERVIVEAIHEEVFDHASFTGRSGAMYGYEGIGSVYWHMVAKLALAVQEQYVDAIDRGEPADVVDALAAAYRRVRDGLGFRKSPAEYGAFPTDCYSHTPAGGGARQPGMTGQVKEEMLTRLGELGLRVDGGTIRTLPTPLDPTELFGADLAGTVSLSFCGTPFTIAVGDRPGWRFERTDGRTDEVAGDRLPAATSAEVFARSGTVTHVSVAVRPPIPRGVRHRTT